MPDHAPRTVQRHCDVAIIGASAAGLAAALRLGRRRRSVIVVDTGEPHNAPGAPTVGRDEVHNYGVEVLASQVSRVTRMDDDRFCVELVGGHSIIARRVLVATGPGDQLPDVDGLAEADPTGTNAGPGLYAAGDVSDPSQQGSQAASDGSRVGAAISLSLDDEDLQFADRPSATQADWDHRYAGDQMWSGNPNGTLVREISGVTPGRALDVGAGEGGDALWLAEQGWRVTANDISRQALGRIGAAAKRRRLSVQCHHADANAIDAFEPGVFDLVSAQYASIHRTPDGRGVRNLVNAVAPGGTLLIVSHDLEPMRAPTEKRAHSMPFDPDAYVQVDDFAAALADSSEWDIEVHEKRPRPAGAASASQHAVDIVLRARRRTPSRNRDNTRRRA